MFVNQFYSIISSNLYQANKMFKKALKFGIVGMINTAIDYTLFQLIIFFLKIQIKDNLYIFFVSLFSGSIALTNSFILNKKWTFRDKNEKHLLQFIVFLLISILTININSTLVVFLNNLFPGNFSFHNINIKNIYYTKLLAIAFTMVINFALYRLFVFKNNDSE